MNDWSKKYCIDRYTKAQNKKEQYQYYIGILMGIVATLIGICMIRRVKKLKKQDELLIKDQQY